MTEKQVEDFLERLKGAHVSGNNVVFLSHSHAVSFMRVTSMTRDVLSAYYRIPFLLADVQEPGLYKKI